MCASGDVIVVSAKGNLDADGARRLLDLAASAAMGCRSVQIDLDGIDALSEEAAALLLFRETHCGHVPGEIVIRTSGRSGRQAVLGAYARRRARRAPGA